VFRASIHRRGNAVFVLDKAGEAASAGPLASWLGKLASDEGVRWRIAVLTRSASELPEVHKASIAPLHAGFDEFACFDRPDTYDPASKLACYETGSLPGFLRDELLRLSAERGRDTPVTTHPGWDAARDWLDRRLSELEGPVLVLINQPATAVSDLNDAILDYVEGRDGAAG